MTGKVFTKDALDNLMDKERVPWSDFEKELDKAFLEYAELAKNNKWAVIEGMLGRRKTSFAWSGEFRERRER